MSDKKIDLGLTAYDDLFETDKSREENEQERVVNIPISEISDFQGHTFEVVDDEEMKDLFEKVKERGVRQPAIIRPKQDGGYEMVCGHRRKFVCEQLGISSMPCIVRNLSDEDATIDMVESNLTNRQNIKPSVKAKSYKVWYEAKLKKAGRPSKENSSPVGTRSDEALAKEIGESRTQLHRYMRLTNLIPDLMNLVDDGKIAIRPAEEISYLTAEQQSDLFTTIEAEDRTPSHAQAIKMKNFAKDGRLSDDVILSIMIEEKPNQKEQIKIPKKSIEKFFKTGTPAEQIENDIVKPCYD